MEKIRSFIKALSGENIEQVHKIIKENSQWFGETDEKSFIHSNFYGLYSEDNKLIGFFAVSDWQYGTEKVICFLYIFEDYREKGLFNKIIKYVKKTFTECSYITIGATVENKIANEIYNRKFRFITYSEEDRGNWYLVLERGYYGKEKL